MISNFVWGSKSGLERRPAGRVGVAESRGQYSLGKWMMLLAKWSAMASSGKSVYSISLLKTFWKMVGEFYADKLRFNNRRPADPRLNRSSMNF